MSLFTRGERRLALVAAVALVWQALALVAVAEAVHGWHAGGAVLAFALGLSLPHLDRLLRPGPGRRRAR